MVFDARYQERRSDLLSGGVIVLHLALVNAPIYVAAAIGPSIALLGLWLWFGIAQNGLINLMHECAHELAFKRRWANRLLGGYLLGPLVLSDFDAYRDRHWQHHRELGNVRDPKVVYRTDIRRWRLLQLLARCLTMTEGVRLLLAQTPVDAATRTTARRGLSLARIAVVQGLFAFTILATASAFHPSAARRLVSFVLAYGLVYGYGVGTLTVFMAALRAIAEHQIGPDRPETEGLAALRNFRCRGLSRLVMGAYGFGEHATHHEEPAIPYYHLPEATEELVRRRPHLTATRGYFGTLGILIRQSSA